VQLKTRLLFPDRTWASREAALRGEPLKARQLRGVRCRLRAIRVKLTEAILRLRSAPQSDQWRLAADDMQWL
jgi:hypothetical protein